MMKKCLILANITICFFITFLMLTFITEAIASDATAASCSASDIQSAINACLSTGGGTVSIPACNADNTWSSDDKIRVDSDVPFKLIGAGADSTIIGYQDGAYPGYEGAMFFDGGGIEEIAHFTIRGSDTTEIGTGLKFYSMNTENLTIHHLKIQKFSGAGINLCANPNSPFVIHHNEIGDQWGSYLYGIYIVGTNNQDDYVIPPSLGINNPNAVFIEDNIFDDCYHSISAFAVAKVVLRHNIVKNMTSFVDGHGPCYDVGCRRDTRPDSGVYIYEIYDNIFIRGDWCVNIRGGTGIVTDNQFDGCHPGFRLEMENCSPGADCDDSKGCPHSNTDTTKCYQSPYMWWIWNNTLLNGADLFGYDDGGTGCIRDNYEYYLRAPKAGDPIESYTKYPYPHPLISGEDPIPPDPTPLGNTAPVAVVDSYNTKEGTQLNLMAPGVLGNDSDAEGDALSAVLDTTPTNGALTLNADGSFRYTPDNSFSGSDSFSYHANDGVADSNTVTVNISVDSSLFSTEIIIDNTDSGFSTAGSWGTSSYWSGYFGSNYRYAALGDGSNWAKWTFQLNSSDNCEVLAQWTAHENRSAAAPYTIYNNGTAVSAPITKDQRVNGGAFRTLGTFWLEAGTAEVVLNNAPDGYVIADAVKIVSEDGAPLVRTLERIEIEGPSVVDENSGADYVCRAYYSDSTNAVVSVDSWKEDCAAADIDAFGHMITFEVTANETCTATATYSDDSVTKSGVKDVIIRDTDLGNAAPVASADTYSTVEDTPLDVVAPGVLDNDSDANGDVIKALLDADPVNGTLTLNADGSFRYTPDSGFSGTDSFSYRASDGTADSSVVTVTITVTINPILTNYQPTAEFEFVNNRKRVTFTDLSTDSDGTIVSRKWSFGDGHIRTTTSQNIKHKYRRFGTYHVTLTVTDDGGKTNSITHEVVVRRKYRRN